MRVATAAPANKQPLIPLRYGTRNRSRSIPVQVGQTFSENGQFYCELPKIGLLHSLEIMFSGYLTFGSGGGVITPFGPWDLLKRIRLRLNLGSTTVYDTSGYMNYLLQISRHRAYDPAGAKVYAAPVAAGEQYWLFHYKIPVAANDGWQFDTGLINLQAPEVVCTLEGTYGTLAGAVSNVSSIGAGAKAPGIYVKMNYFDLPDPSRVSYPPAILHRILEQRQLITATGDQIITMPRDGLLYRALHHVVVNDAQELASDYWRLRLNGSDYLYSIASRDQVIQMMAERYSSQVFPTGFYAPFDFWNASGQPGEGDGRDMINREAVTTSEIIFNMPTTLGGTNNLVDTLYEFQQALVA